MRYRMGLCALVVAGAMEAHAAEPIVAASSLRERVAPGGQIYVLVAMGGVPMEGTRPSISGIAYDSRGQQYRMRRKSMDEYFSQHLAFNVPPHSPRGRYTIHVTVEQDQRAWGMPIVVEVGPPPR